MPKSLAELRKSPHVGRPEQEFHLCVAGKLNVEFDRIETEIERLLEENPPTARTDEDGEPTGPPRRLGQKQLHPRVKKQLDEKNARREELRAEMAEHTVVLLLRARPDGEWRNWVNEHPPREDNRLDERAGHDVDALIEDLRTNPRAYVVAVNGEAYTDDDWAFIWSSTADGDQWRMATTVRGLHLTGVDVPKSLTTWLAKQTNGGSSK
jgi:sulfur carrier protein ThiS